MAFVKMFDDDVSLLTAAEHHGQNVRFPCVVTRNIRLIFF